MTHKLKKSLSVRLLLRLQLFEQKDAENDLPESGRGVEIKQRGYLFKTHVQLTKEEYYYKTKDSIFPDKLSTSAVKQTVLGDCFLLSAVVSILSATGCEYFFRSMMRQNKETGLTYVRVYNPNTNKPVCLVVRNDIFFFVKKMTIACSINNYGFICWKKLMLDME